MAALKSKERWIKFVALDFCPSKSDAGYISQNQFYSAIVALQKLVTDNNSTYLTDNGNIETSLDQIVWLDEDKKRLCLLISQGDSSRSDPSFRNRTTGDKREAKRLDGEDPAFSAHLLIDISVQENNSIKCYGYLEEISGITPGHITALLRFLFRKTRVKFTYTRPDHTKYHFYITTNVRVYAIKKLEEQYDETDIESIIFERTEPVSELDEDSYVVKGKGRLEVKLEHKPKNFEVLWEWLSKFREKVEQRRGHYDKMKVRYKADDRNGSFDVTQGKKKDAIEALLAKYNKIFLDNEIKQCQEIIHKEFVAKINKELDSILANK